MANNSVPRSTFNGQTGKIQEHFIKKDGLKYSICFKDENGITYRNPNFSSQISYETARMYLCFLKIAPLPYFMINTNSFHPFYASLQPFKVKK